MIIKFLNFQFNNLKIVLEHVSSEYGADFITESGPNIAATVTIHHLTLTKKDVFQEKIPLNMAPLLGEHTNDILDEFKIELKKTGNKE